MKQQARQNLDILVILVLLVAAVIIDNHDARISLLSIALFITVAGLILGYHSGRLP